MSFPTRIITKNISLPADLLGGKVKVHWQSNRPEVLSHDGEVQSITSAQEASLNAILSKGESTLSKRFDVSVLPEDLPPYTITIHGDQQVADISEVMYGLFYEDINNAADGEFMPSWFRTVHLNLLHLIHTHIPPVNAGVRQGGTGIRCSPGLAKRAK